jgi:hypothetical protein
MPATALDCEAFFRLDTILLRVDVVGCLATVRRQRHLANSRVVVGRRVTTPRFLSFFAIIMHDRHHDHHHDHPSSWLTR